MGKWLALVFRMVEAFLRQPNKKLSKSWRSYRRRNRSSHKILPSSPRPYSRGERGRWIPSASREEWLLWDVLKDSILTIAGATRRGKEVYRGLCGKRKGRQGFALWGLCRRRLCRSRQDAGRAKASKHQTSGL